MKTAIIAALLFFPSLTAAYYVGHAAGVKEGYAIDQDGRAADAVFNQIVGQIEGSQRAAELFSR